MNRRLVMVALVATTASACWPFRGKPKAAPSAVLANSPRAVDSLWQVGQRAFNSGRWNEANQVFARLGTAMPVADPRIARLNFYKGEVEFALGNELDAVRQFRRLSDEAPDDSLAPDALLRAADAYAALWKRPELDPTYGQTALGVYQEVQSRYPNTAAAKRAAARVGQLNDQFAEKEYASALFYYNFKADNSAVLILRSLVLKYPRSAIVPEALATMVLAYRRLGYDEDIKETCGYIAQTFGVGQGPRRFCPVEPPVTADSALAR